MLKMRHGAISQPFVYGTLRPALRFGNVGGADKWITDRSLSHDWQVAFASFSRELHCPNGAGARINIACQWHDPEILLLFFFCYKNIPQKMGRILKPLVPKFRSDLSIRLNYIVEKRVPAKLKPIVFPALLRIW